MIRDDINGNQKLSSHVTENPRTVKKNPQRQLCTKNEKDLFDKAK